MRRCDGTYLEVFIQTVALVLQRLAQLLLLSLQQGAD